MSSARVCPPPSWPCAITASTLTTISVFGPIIYVKGVAGELFKDLSIAGASFFLASYVPRFGYRRTMLVGLMAVMLASMLVAAVTGFWVTQVLYAAVGISFALMKTAVYSTIGLITNTQAEHTGLLNNLEGVFQVGAMSGPLVFAFMIGFSRWTDTYWLLATLILIALGLFPDQDAALYLTAVRNVAKYSPPPFAAAKGAFDDWEILTELTCRLAARRNGAQAVDHDNENKEEGAQG